MKPRNKRFSIVMISIFIGLHLSDGVRLLSAGDSSTLLNCKAETNIDREDCFDEISQVVAGKMGIEINKNLPKPIILTDDQISLRQFNSYLGWESVVIFPYYFSKKNTLVIPTNCGLDSLAHELVHYFQYTYRNDNFDFNFGPYIENLEMEAVSIQEWFKASYQEHKISTHGIAVTFSHQSPIIP